MSEREELLADALDHIARVAQGSRNPTRRLDWITARARRALAGKPFDQFDLPKYPKMIPVAERDQGGGVSELTLSPEELPRATAIRSSGNEGK